MTALEQMITNDLASLAEDTRRDLPSVEDAIPADAGAYRDGRPGAEARRDSLLAARHFELAALPMALQRTFVHRVSRAAAGAVGILAALTLGVGLLDEFMARLARFLIPELNMTVCVLGIGMCILAAYIIGGWIAERIYERRVRGSIRVTGDAYSDLDSLAEGPLVEARRLLAEIDGWAVGLPLIALALLIPLLAVLALFHGPSWSFGPRLLFLDLSPHMMGSAVMYVAVGIIVAVIGAIVLARACHRESRLAERPRVIRALAHWAVIPAAFALGLTVLAVLGNSIYYIEMRGVFPSEGVRGFMSVAGAIAVTAPFAWLVLLIRRREHARITGDQ